MGQKREEPPLVKPEYGPKRVKSEKFEDTKFDLHSIPPAPTEFKVKEEADSKPEFSMTGPAKNGTAQKWSSSSKRPHKSRRYFHSPQVVKVYLDSSRNRGISGHYDGGREKVFLRGHGDFDWNSDLSPVGRIFDRLLSVNLHVIPASMPILVRPTRAKPGYTHEVDVVHGKWDRQKMPAVTAMLAPAPGLFRPPSLLFQAGPRGGDLGFVGVGTPPSGVTIKADEKDE
ncbi:hypothetical protein DL768_007324 [Monosporascus sp. mg162]|nr:hypothetical protein DL768_007324 [Monosporascus sp. mg162]